MNKTQWAILGIGMILLSIFLFTMTGPGCSALVLSGDMLTSCMIRRYAYAVPAIISFFLGISFTIVSIFTKK